MDEREKLKAALRHELGKLAREIDLDKVVAETLAETAPAAAPADGFWLLYQKRDGQYLAVHPPAGGGAAVTREMIARELERKQTAKVNQEAVTELVRLADGKPRRISPAIEEYRNLGSELSLKVSKDEAHAFLTVPQQLFPDFPNRVRTLLVAENVCYGVDERKLKVIADLVGKEAILIHHTQIAYGKLPTRGKPGRIRYEFDVRRDATPLQLADGRVNYYQLNLIRNVRKDQTLVVRYPPQLGDPGLTVRGASIPPLPGKDVTLLPGQNVKVTEDGRQAFSLASGNARCDGGMVSVEPVYTVPGDVDFSTGNLNIEGTLVITGWVRAGFEVTAASDIEILGGIEGATVISRGGSIYVHGGVQGQGRARLEARYDITAAHVENAWLSARRNIKIRDSLLHSLTIAHNSVQVFEKRGVIIGGLVRTRGNIVAKQVGGDMGTKTELRIENLESQGLLDELDHIEKNLAQCENDKHLIERQVMSRFGSTAAKVGDNMRNMDQLVHFSDLDAKIRMFRARKEELTRALALPERSNIKVKDVVYPGTVISFGGTQLPIVEPHRFVTFYWREGEIRFLPFAE